MSVLISAELLRLRTVRSARYSALGVLACVAVFAALQFIDASEPGSATQLATSLRGLIQVPGVVLVGTLAATLLATEFQHGSASLTYLSHPDRLRVAAARSLAYAGLGFLLAGAAALVVVAIGVPASGAGADTSLSMAEVARIVVGAATGGAVMGAAGALVGTATHSPTIASGAFFGWNIVETLLIPVDARPYMPFGLINSLMGAGGEGQGQTAFGAGGVALPAAIGLLLAYLTAGALVTRRWALPRDLT